MTLHLTNQIAFMNLIFRVRYEEFHPLISHKTIKNKVPYLPLVLVGNKNDLVNRRTVKQEEAKKLACEILKYEWSPSNSPRTHFEEAPEDRAIPVYDASAKTRVNVDLAFHAAVRQALIWKNFKEGKLLAADAGAHPHQPASNKNSGKKKAGFFKSVSSPDETFEMVE